MGLRVLVAIHHFPPTYTGGAEGVAARLVHAMRARGHEVSVVCVERIDQGPKDGLAWKDELYEGIHVRRLFFDLSSAPDPRRWEFANVWIGDHIRGMLRAERPDLFHLYGGYLLSGSTLEAAYAEAVPTVVSLTDMWYLCPRITMLRSDGELSTLPIDSAVCARCLGEESRRYRIPGQIAPRLMQAYWRGKRSKVDLLESRRKYLLDVLGQADVIVSPSHFLRSLYAEAGVPDEKFVVIPHGTDMSAASKPDRPQAVASLRVAYLGQIAEHKGVHLLIEAARSIDDPRLSVRIHGDTSRFPSYADRLTRLSGADSRIELVGRYQDQADLVRIMQGIDVVVVPSMWYENCPNVILEAFACQTPVIATNLGGMAELVSYGGNGLLFQRGDSEDLATQLRRLLAEPELLSTLRAGIPPVSTLTHEVDQIEGLYRRLADITSRRASTVPSNLGAESAMPAQLGQPRQIA
jgi:glycosyltransferase involved in cell wall biosynthesis